MSQTTFYPEAAGSSLLIFTFLPGAKLYPAQPKPRAELPLASGEAHPLPAMRSSED